MNAHGGDRTGADPRPDLLIASTLHLMTHYARTGCPKLAACIAHHLQCLATHGEVDPCIRDICAGMHGVWQQTGRGVTTTRGKDMRIH